MPITNFRIRRAHLHGLGSGLGREYALVAVALQLWQEEVVELIRLDLLQRDDVGAAISWRLFIIMKEKILN